jgi:hypothetical protein
LIQSNKLWLGYSSPKKFATPGNEIGESPCQTYQFFGNVGWFTNFPVSHRNEELILWKEYNKNDNQKYDNYDAINVDKVKEIPRNYFGSIGVPTTFLDFYNPKQFQILGSSSSLGFSKGRPYINGKRMYDRLIIKRRQYE